jgi:hypothetical protein
MGEVARAEHGVNKGESVRELSGFGSGDSEKTKGIGVESVELAFMAEAREDGLGASEAERGVLVGELRY